MKPAPGATRRLWRRIAAGRGAALLALVATMSDTEMREAEASVLHAPKRAKAPKDAIKVPPAVKARWRDLTVAQLPHLPPATVAPSATVQAALQTARAHHGQCVLIVDGGQLRGYVDMIDLVAQETQGSLDDPVSSVQQPLAGTRRAPRFPTTYRVIHRGTPLAEVAAFLSTAPFALVTEAEPRNVESVITASDLERYADVAQLDAPAAPIGSRPEEESRRDRSLVDVLQALDGYAPLIPDEVSDYYLERAGFQCDDVRLYVSCDSQQQAALGTGYGKVCGGHCLGRLPVRAYPDERGPWAEQSPWCCRSRTYLYTDPRTAPAPCSRWTTSAPRSASMGLMRDAPKPSASFDRWAPQRA